MIIDFEFAKHRLYQVNTFGRDFIVGDIHGHLDDLEKALWAFGFEINKDRTGDVIDKGPDSLGVLNLFLDNPDTFKFSCLCGVSF